MKKLVYVMALLMLTAACKKNNETKTSTIDGVWVETSLRLDTIDFTVNSLIDNSSGYEIFDLKSRQYTDIVLNPNFPVNHSAMYNYYVNTGDTVLNLRSFLSSYSGFQQYNFLRSGNYRFMVGKFYNRRSLPAVIEFERIR